MKNERAILDCVKNMRFYIQRIQGLASEQFKIDSALGEKSGINTRAGAIRFDSLACVNTNAQWINCYCDGIENNVETAVKMDKYLNPEHPDYQEYPLPTKEQQMGEYQQIKQEPEKIEQSDFKNLG